MRVLVVLLISVFLFAANFDWVHDLSKAKELAKKENKPIMVMIDKEGCPACGYMDEVAFETDELSDFIENFFIPVKIDYKKAKKLGFKVYGTPTFYFLDKNAKQIARPLVGAATAKVFLEKVKEYKKLSEK